MLDDFDWRGAEAEFQRAIALNPSYATAHQWYAEELRASGRLADGLAEMERARALDPLSRIIADELGYYLALSGRYDEGLRLLRATIELDPSFAHTYLYLCGAYLARQLPGDAAAACEHAVTLSGRSEIIWRQAYAFAAAGERPRAAAVLRDLEVRSRHGYVPPTAIAAARLAVGDTSGALAWLDSAYVARDPAFTMNNDDDPVWSSLRADGRFVRLRTRMGLPP